MRAPTFALATLLAISGCQESQAMRSPESRAQANRVHDHTAELRRASPSSSLPAAHLTVPATIRRGTRLQARFSGCPHHQDAASDAADGLGIYFHDHSEVMDNHDQSGLMRFHLQWRTDTSGVAELTLPVSTPRGNALVTMVCARDDNPSASRPLMVT